MRDLHRASELATLLRAEASHPPPRQLAWPWGPAATEPVQGHADELEAFLVEFVADAEWLEYPPRTCRAINPAACDHEACAIVREYRARVAALTRRARVVLGGGRR